MFNQYIANVICEAHPLMPEEACRRIAQDREQWQKLVAECVVVG